MGIDQSIDRSTDLSSSASHLRSIEMCLFIMWAQSMSIQGVRIHIHPPTLVLLTRTGSVVGYGPNGVGSIQPPTPHGPESRPGCTIYLDRHTTHFLYIDFGLLSKAARPNHLLVSVTVSSLSKVLARLLEGRPGSFFRVLPVLVDHITYNDAPRNPYFLFNHR